MGETKQELCGSKFTHPGHGEAFLEKRENLDEIEPVKGKVFTCDKPAGHKGHHGARIKGDGTSADKPKDGDRVKDVSWEHASQDAA